MTMSLQGTRGPALPTAKSVDTFVSPRGTLTSYACEDSGMPLHATQTSTGWAVGMGPGGIEPPTSAL